MNPVRQKYFTHSYYKFQIKSITHTDSSHPCPLHRTILFKWCYWTLTGTGTLTSCQVSIWKYVFLMFPSKYPILGEKLSKCIMFIYLTSIYSALGMANHSTMCCRNISEPRHVSILLFWNLNSIRLGEPLDRYIITDILKHKSVTIRISIKEIQGAQRICNRDLA